MFSIIVPLYNEASFICRAIESIKGQSFSKYEIIVVNDGSTDGGDGLVRSQYGGYVKLLHQANNGVSSARNNGIREAKFKYIAFLDADDVWHHDYLKYINLVITLNPTVGIIGTGYTSSRFDNITKAEYFNVQDYFKRAIKNTMFLTSATVIKKSFFNQNEGFDPNLKIGEDLDVWFRANLFYESGIYIKNKLVFYEQENKNKATKKQYIINETLISKIVLPKYYNSSISGSTVSKIVFELFRDKWIYFNLFPFFQDLSNKEVIFKTLDLLPKRLFLARWIYFLPFDLLHLFFKNDKIKKLYRNYLKFCFRYIYP